MLFDSRMPEETPTVKMEFQKGDHVTIKEGPFENYEGTVDEVLPDKGLVRVLVTIFGRQAPDRVGVLADRPRRRVGRIPGGARTRVGGRRVARPAPALVEGVREHASGGRWVAEPRRIHAAGSWWSQVEGAA